MLPRLFTHTDACFEYLLAVIPGQQLAFPVPYYRRVVWKFQSLYLFRRDHCKQPFPETYTGNLRQTFSADTFGKISCGTLLSSRHRKPDASTQKTSSRTLTWLIMEIRSNLLECSRSRYGCAQTVSCYGYARKPLWLSPERLQGYLVVLVGLKIAKIDLGYHKGTIKGKLLKLRNFLKER